MARKKKGNTLHAQKIEKAHHRNEFIARLSKFCDDVTADKTFQLIPAHVIEGLYRKRIHPPRLRAAAGQEVPEEMLLDAKKLTSILFKHNTIKLGIGKIHEISLYDFYTLADTLMLYAKRVKASDYPLASIVKERLAPLTLLEKNGTYELSWKYMGETMTLVSLFYSHLHDHLYALKFEVRSIVDGRPGLILCMEIYSKKTEVQSFSIDGANRPAYRVGWYSSLNLEKLSFLAIKPEQVLMPPGEDMSVFIQAHALERLSERLDCIETGILHYNICTSLEALKVCSNKKGEMLLEFSLFKEKVGYFVATMIDNNLLIRTFLFLTNNGTPEGEKLHATTGIMKEDKIFLQIDKLSTFLNSDIRNNERLQNIFVKAGCQSLIEMDRNMAYTSSETPLKQVAEYISNYLKKDGGTKH
jgi:hypothetical protein